MRFWLYILLGFNCLNCFSQDSTVIYYTSSWKITDKPNAHYYRVLKKISDNHWEVDDYTTDNIPYFSGQFKSEKVKEPFGEFINYGADGTILEVYHYNNESELDGPYLTYTENGLKDTERFYKNGKKEGLWKWYYETGTVAWFEQWSNDSLVMLQQFSTSEKEYKTLFNVSIAPKWKLQEQSFDAFILENLPEALLEKGIKADVYICISRNGKVTRVYPKSKMDVVLQEALNDLFINGPDWLPGLNHLRPIDGILEVEINTKK